LRIWIASPGTAERRALRAVQRHRASSDDNAQRKRNDQFDERMPA
jgi:hypothetical protein